MEPIHMELSQKLKTFSGFFPAFLKSRLNFELFQKKDDAPSLFISEATACKKRGEICVKTPALDYPSKSNMANESQLCLNLSDNTCTIFIQHREGSLVATSPV